MAPRDRGGIHPDRRGLVPPDDAGARVQRDRAAVQDHPERFGTRVGREHRRADPVDGRDEPIAAARQCLHEARPVRSVAEGSSQLVHGLVQTLLEVPGHRVRPHSLLQLFPGDQLTGALEKHLQDAEGLFLQVDPPALAPELAGLEVGLERTERHETGVFGLHVAAGSF